MIELSSSELLFQNQPVYRVSQKQNTEKTAAKKVLLVYENEAEQLPIQIKEMLDKLVLACRFLPNETEYINMRYKYRGTSLGDWKNTFSPQLVLIFGNIPVSRNVTELKKNFPYTLDSVQVISTETLDRLSGNDKEKGALWLSLKKMLKL